MFENLKQILMPLAAVLRELDFGSYLDGTDFENFLLKNQVAKIWKDNRLHTIAQIGKSQSDKSLITFMNVLNEYLNREVYTYEQKQTFVKNINFFILKFFEFYLKKENIEKDYTELLIELENLKNKELIFVETLKDIKDFIEKKEYKEIIVKMDNQNNEKFHEQYDYAIITALEDDEMDKILEVATIEDEIENEKYLLRKGYFNKNPSKKILFASQNFSGFVDSAILTAEIISKYKVKLIIMPGVLGGNPSKTNFGDVIVANKVFTIDKGKIEEGNFNSEIESSNITHNLINKIKANKQKIVDYIRDSHSENKTVDIYFEPIACVRHVISKKGYFLENISSLDRKAYGVEMESYGVVRATELANDGKTKVLIIKSVMDKTENKGDSFKKFASFTSARTVEFLFKENIV